MIPLNDLGKMLIGIGISIVIIGVVLLLMKQLPLLGKLPGDISIQTENISCFIPIASSIVLSIMLTVVLNLILRLISK